MNERLEALRSAGINPASDEYRLALFIIQAQTKLKIDPNEPLHILEKADVRRIVTTHNQPTIETAESRANPKNQRT